MFKKRKVRSILELLGKNLSAREVSKVLGVSRNTAAEVLALFLQSGRSRDDISEWDDGRLYGLFYRDSKASAPSQAYGKRHADRRDPSAFSAPEKSVSGGPA